MKSATLYPIDGLDVLAPAYHEAVKPVRLSWLSRLMAALRAVTSDSNTRAQMERLDSHILRDIGLSADDVRRM